MKQFEYRVVTVETKGFSGGKADTQELEALLCQMGAQGWQLTKVVATHMGQGATRSLVHYFEREII